MIDSIKISRRDFIKVVSASGTGLVLGVYLSPPAHGQDKQSIFEPDVFIRIDVSDIVTITVHRSEMGQGARTIVPMMIAEELEAGWNKMKIEQALADPKKYGSMATAGSTTVRTNWERLRKAGATAREMLISAAAEIWGVSAVNCRAENSAVIHVPTGRKLTYGQLASTAAAMPIPKDVPLKQKSDFRIIGKNIPRLDSPEKVTGKAIYGIDLKLPGMRYAAIARSPVPRGKVKSFNATAAKAIKGVRDVFEISRGIAVVADDTWSAFKGKEALTIEWDDGPNARLDSAEIWRTFEDKSKGELRTARKEGDFADGFANAVKKLDAVYRMPFIPHATLEPMNCTAEVRDSSVEIWAPTQDAQTTQEVAAEVAGVPIDKVKVHTLYSGGGFGRRLMWDFVVEAVLVAKRIGALVKVVWTREDDMTNDYYRPASYHKLSAGINGKGDLVAWQHRIVGPSISAQLFPDQPERERPDLIDGAANIQYKIPNMLIEFVIANTPIQVSWWRSVYNSQHSFVNECFMDEIAHAAGADPLEFRLRLLPKDSRLRGVLELAGEKSGWGKPLASRKGRGIAAHFCFGSYIAHVAEVTVSERGELRLDRMVSAIDCGYYVHPEILRQQIEGGIIFGLSAALSGEITVANGRIQQTNFDGFTPPAMGDAPVIEVHIKESTDAPGGIGEPGLPPTVPAVCNAIFAACGKRIRKLPIGNDELK